MHQLPERAANGALLYDAGHHREYRTMRMHGHRSRQPPQCALLTADIAVHNSRDLLVVMDKAQAFDPIQEVLLMA